MRSPPPDHAFGGAGPSPDTGRAARRRVALHVAVLTALAAVVFLPGLDTFGVYGWQEGQRLLVAQQMDARLRAAASLVEAAEALIVPRVNGLAYVAKPPMIYWAQMLAAGATGGGGVTLWHLRLVVALAGALGVLATYWAGRRILAADGPWLGIGGVSVEPGLRDSAAFWGAAMTCTGLLYARSGRIGELDILLALACTLAIGAAAWSWASWRRSGRAGLTAVTLACAATVAAALCKDPAVMIIALGGYGGIVLHAAAQAGRRPPGRAERVLPAAVGLVAAAYSARTVEHWTDGFGAAIAGFMCGCLAWVAVRLADPVRLRAAARALHGSRAWLVLGLGVCASVGWRLAIARLISPAEAERLLGQEIEDNLRPLVAEAPLNNLKAMSFGVGAGSVMAVMGALWLLRDRPRLPAGWWVLVAWLALNLCAFSLLGKGVQRYLTPVWPAVGLLGGLALATMLRLRPWRRGPAWVVGGAVVALAVGQAWHYGYGRQRTHAALSPRGLALELMSMPGLDTRRLHSFEFASPGLESCLGGRVTPVGELRVNVGMSGGPALTLEQFAAHVRAAGATPMLVATEGSRDARAGSAVSRLREAGFELRRLPTRAEFRHSDRWEIGLFEVSLAEGAGGVSGRSASPAP